MSIVAHEGIHAAIDGHGTGIANLRTQCEALEARILNQQITAGGRHILSLLRFAGSDASLIDQLIAYSLAVEARCRGTRELLAVALEQLHDHRRENDRLRGRLHDALEEARELRRHRRREAA